MTRRGAGGVHYAWVVLGGTAVTLLAASGVRSALGVFIQPMETEFDWDRTTLSSDPSEGVRGWALRRERS